MTVQLLEKHDSFSSYFYIFSESTVLRRCPESPSNLLFTSSIENILLNRERHLPRSSLLVSWLELEQLSSFSGRLSRSMSSSCSDDIVFFSEIGSLESLIFRSLSNKFSLFFPEAWPTWLRIKLAS